MRQHPLSYCWRSNLPLLFVFISQLAGGVDIKIIKRLFDKSKHLLIHKQIPVIIKLSWKRGLVKYGSCILIWAQNEDVLVIEDALIH